MADFFSSEQKAQLEAVFTNIHDTFARDISIYKKKKSIYVATNQTYNALYARIKDQAKTIEEVTTTTVKARIQYMDRQYIAEEYALRAQTNLPISEGQLRIKLDPAGYEAFTFANRIEIDGFVWKIKTDEAAIGLFSPHFYMLYLERAE
jgi:hypothetical protein